MRRASIDSLALLGGERSVVHAEPHYVWPRVTDTMRRAVMEQLERTISIYDRSDIFETFENEFATWHHKRHALVCNSGTTAIHSMFVACQLEPGDEVICPAYTFFATVSPLLWTGAIPVLCDCDGDGNIDPDEIENKITERTKAVIITHMWGVPCQMDRIVAICQKYNLRLLEDCSHAHGAEFHGKKVGTFGDMAAWSLQGAKLISGGEGGVIVTDDDELYYRLLLSGHYNKRCKQEIPQDHPHYKFATTGMGLKYRAHPLAIAVAYELLHTFNDHDQIRQRRAAEMIDVIGSFECLRTPRLPDDSKPSWYVFMTQYDQEACRGLPFERFFEALIAEGLIEADRPGSTSPLHLLPLFQSPEQLFSIYRQHKFSYQPGDFPRAEKFYHCALKFPVWAHEDEEDLFQDYVKGITKVLTHYQTLL